MTRSTAEQIKDLHYAFSAALRLCVKLLNFLQLLFKVCGFCRRITAGNCEAGPRYEATTLLVNWRNGLRNFTHEDDASLTRAI
jgi:hypothetical protein